MSSAFGGAPAVVAGLLLALAPLRAAAQTTAETAPPLIPLGIGSSATAVVRSPPASDEHAQTTIESPAPTCTGCPGRHLWRPYLSSLGLNALYNMGNRLRGHETASIGPSSWYANMKHGFEWDNNPFGVNQFGHPYQGSNYFTAGRANGLSFWESTAAAFGSAAWEFYFENNRASLNDLVNTTLGGIALGEVMHRAAWLVRNPRETGRRRLTQEIIATAIDPLTGVTRFASHDASRLTDKPANVIPSSLELRTSAGTLWQGPNARSPIGSMLPFLDVDLRYGDMRSGTSHVPYDAFTLEATVGGGNKLSEAVARGRFYGKSFGADDQYQFTVRQTFDYLVNRAYVFGGQGFDAEIAMHDRVTPRMSLRLAAAGGGSVLAAVDSLLPAPPEAGDPNAPFTNPESRHYDYGPGFRVQAETSVAVDRMLAASLSYYLYHVAVVDGFRSNQLLQRAYLDVRWLPGNQIAVGAASEYLFRKSYFWAAGDRTNRSQQFRVYLAWATPRMPVAAQPATGGSPTAAADVQALANQALIPAARERPGLWIVTALGGVLARGHCGTCDRHGVFFYSPGVLVDGGVQINRRVDAGIEVAFVTSKIEDLDPTRTTFVLGVGQFRPWENRGLSLRGGMGIGFVGNAIYNFAQPNPPPPFTTNAIALVLGIGWEFLPKERFTLQLLATQHVVALGELTTPDGSIKNVVGNYWTTGVGLVFR